MCAFPSLPSKVDVCDLQNGVTWPWFRLYCSIQFNSTFAESIKSVLPSVTLSYRIRGHESSASSCPKEIYCPVDKISAEVSSARRFQSSILYKFIIVDTKIRTESHSPHKRRIS